MSPRSLNEASSIAFVAVTFALLGFCISGTFGFAMQYVLHIYIILHLYYFSAVLFCCSVFCSAVCSTLLGLVLLSELQCAVVYSTV